VVRQFLKDKGVNQEFTHVATPEENAYIEALHSNVQREVVERFEFESIYHAQMIFNRYYDWYNNHRKHGALGRKSPILSQILTPFCPKIKGSIHMER
jgi:transposase InsO family protein